MIKQAVLIREFEKRLLELFDEGILQGTTHTCIGQELIAVAVMACLSPQDIVISNHRGHGHYIARTNDVKGLLAEIMGLPEGVCGGIGGSQHLHNKKFNYYSNGVQGNMFPVAAGMAMAHKNEDVRVVVFIGDGTLGQGVVYETLNMISLWQLPVTVVVENNKYAQTTPTHKQLSGDIGERFRAFGIDTTYTGSANANDFQSILTNVQQAFSCGLSPCHAIIYDTYRLGPHSKGDDFRSQRELDHYTSVDWYNNIDDDMKTEARNIVLKIERELRHAL